MPAKTQPAVDDNPTQPRIITYPLLKFQPAAVVAALAKVAAEMPAIGKGRKSPEGYAYRGIEDITEAAGRLLSKHGVVIVPVLDTVEVVPTPAGKDGWTDVRSTYRWTIYGPDGSHIEARTAGIGRDRSDKGANKAQTQAYKYLLLALLNISEGEADDAEAHDTRPSIDHTAQARVDAIIRRLGDVTVSGVVKQRVSAITKRELAEKLLADPPLLKAVEADLATLEPQP